MFASLSATAKLILAALTVLLAAFAVWWLYSTWTAKPKAEAKLRGNQVEAVQESGKDAVNTIGKAGEREAAVAEADRTNEGEIRGADGAGDVVRAPARDAGLAALCRRAAYKDNARCKN